MSDDDFPERPMTGLFAQLTPEQQKRALEYDGPDSSGPSMDDLRESVMRRTKKIRAFLAAH